MPAESNGNLSSKQKNTRDLLIVVQTDDKVAKMKPVSKPSINGRTKMLRLRLK